MTSTPPDSPDAPGPSEGPSFSREQILSEAIVLLQERGTLGFRLHDLANRLGVTVSALYYHFRNRDAIIEEAFLQIFERETTANLAFVTSFARFDPTAHEQVSSLTNLVERIRSDDARLMRRTRLTALTSLPDDLLARSEIADALRAAGRATTDAYRDSQRRGVVRADLDPEAIALFSRMLLAGMIVWDYDESIAVSSEEFARVLEAVLSGLAANSQG